MRVTRWVTWVSVLAFAASSVARGAEEETETKSTISVGVNVTSGDNNTTTLNGGIRSERISSKNEWVFSAEGNYGETATDTEIDGATVRVSETTTQNAKGVLKYKRLFGRPYAYSDNNILHDDIAGIDYRLIAGVGMGYRLLDSDQSKVGVELGGAYVKEQLDGDEDDDYFAVRLAVSHQQQLSETAKLWESVEYLPQAAEWDDFLVNAEAGVEAMLNRHMSLRLVVQDRYDSTPAGDSEKNNLQAIGSLVYNL